MEDTGQSSLATLRRLLEDLGLSASQARVLAALLSLESAPAAQMARLADVPRTRVYTVLDELRERGLARQLSVNGPARWRAAEADEVVDRLHTLEMDKLARRDAEELRLRERLDDLEKEREERRHQVDQMTQQVRHLLTEEVVGDRDAPAAVFPYLTIRSGIVQVAAEYQRLIAGAQSELLVINRGPYGVVRVDPLILEALGRGVRMRALYVEAQLAAPDMEDLRTALDVYRNAGVEVRVVDGVAVSMAIFDRQTLLCGLHDSEDPLPGSPTHIRIDHPGYASQQADLFDHYWAQSRPYREDRTPLSEDADDDVDVDVDLVGRASAARRGRATTPASAGAGSPSDRRP